MSVSIPYGNGKSTHLPPNVPFPYQFQFPMGMAKGKKMSKLIRMPVYVSIPYGNGKRVYESIHLRSI